MKLSGILILLVIFYLLSDSVDGGRSLKRSCKRKGGILVKKSINCRRVLLIRICKKVLVCVIHRRATTTAATEAATEATTAVTEAVTEDMTTAPEDPEDQDDDVDDEVTEMTTTQVRNALHKSIIMNATWMIVIAAPNGRFWEGIQHSLRL